MDEMAELVARLRSAGVEVTPEIEDVMLETPICEFVDQGIKAFYHDRPVVFLKRKEGGTKTISAPHMIVTLLHQMELTPQRNVVIIGAKGGYLASLVSKLIGQEGQVLVFDPSEDVIEYVEKKTEEITNISCHLMKDFFREPISFGFPLHRVLITGQIPFIPEWIQSKIEEGGFITAPIGDEFEQNLTKFEKQSGELLETSLGPVMFGPVDIKDSEPEPISASEMADVLNSLISPLIEYELLDKSQIESIQRLVEDLMGTKDNMNYAYSDEDHPMRDLIQENEEVFHELWSKLEFVFESHLSSPGAPDHVSYKQHEDFIP